MKTFLPLIAAACLLTSGSAFQNPEEAPSPGVIYGVAFGRDGLPAKKIGLSAFPLGVALAARLPQTQTNEAGQYRFENLAFGKYSVFADDEQAGYSIWRTRTNNGDGRPSEVELTAKIPEANFQYYLPPAAGFLSFHLTNQRSGETIPSMEIRVILDENPPTELYSMGCYSNRVVLIPANKHLLVHVTAKGFQEWKESARNGKQFYLESAERLTVDVPLDALDKPN
jgi:hypothetical protein